LVAIHDITDRKLVEDDLHRTKIFLDTVIENVPLPILVKTAKENRFTLLNRAGEELFGISRDHIIGKTPQDVYEPARADEILARDKEALLSVEPVATRDHSIPTAKRGDRLVTTKKVAIRGSDGQPEYLLTLFDDVTERREAEQRIVRMAHYDTLTELPNRATFNETLDATINRATTTGEQFAILSIDFDGFKEINDTYGHMVGDGLLREIARRLQVAAGETFLARLGGDEFAVILAEGAQPAGAAVLAERLLATLLDDFKVEGHCLKLGMSIGVAIYPADGANAKTLLTNADAALYRAKAETRGMAMFFESEMSARLHERYALQEDLRLAIDHGELLLHYQPQVTMSGDAIGFEALARWQCPKRGMVPPGTFIPIAEESSLIISLGEWVLREACREAASWPQPLTIAVNISPIQFRHGDLPRLIHSILLETGLAPGRLELEITESVMINDFSRAVSILNQLKALGVKIAMDDFGTGYSSLSYLQSFRCDKIKIDRIFICDLEDNYHSRSIVRAVISLGRSLNLPILAEGVETETQHTFLVQEGCDEVQGYLTGRPLPIADYAGVVGRKLIAAEFARAV
jgi:diguanylate cyclase (GGDEF)-like protein/PAS domain S-box-containing protein